MKKAKVLSALGLMSLASTAALAAGGPTLGSVLDASGVKVSGALAASVRQNVSVRSTNNQARSNFQVDQGLLSIAFQPKEGFGGVVDLATGETVAQGGRVGGSTAGVQLSQAYIQYKSGDLTVIGGRYYTAAGFEVFPAAGNLFVTRSEVYGTESTYHTGVRATYAVSDSLSVFGGLNNGVFAEGSAAAGGSCNTTAGTGTEACDAYASTLKNRGLELGVTWSPISDLSLALSTYTGKTDVMDAPATTRNNAHSQYLYSLTANYKVSSALSLGLNIDQGNPDTYGTQAASQKYEAYAGYVTYALSDATTLGVRLEEIAPRGRNDNTGAVAVVLSHSYAKNFDLRTELKDVDNENAVGADRPRQVTLAVQGVLKF